MEIPETLTEIYRKIASGGSLHADPPQLAALELLEEFRIQAQDRKAPTSRLAGILRRRRPQPQSGVHLWGQVGRGKSMLMDLFFDNLEISAKKRVHFLEFMQSIHSSLHEIRKTEVEDTVVPAADLVAGEAGVLCLDEMQIDDIADAMIVGRLFERLFERGVLVLTTSNRPPEELYKFGLNRHLFVPFVKLIRERMQVHELDGGEDYRQGRLAGRKTWFVPADGNAASQIDGIWSELTQGPARSLKLAVKGREVELPCHSNGVARADFRELCARPYGPADYLAVAGAVRVLVIENIPLMSRANHNEARRFVMLIDALYESGIKVVVSAAAMPEQLYVQGSGAFEFERTSSRLAEMQSATWGAVPAVGTGSTGEA